jgi:prepilin-type N-terminal cleavage/methylation domain-containing protein
MSNHREKGFTLLELLIVIVIIVSVSAIAYPSLSRGSATLHLRATGRDILNTFRYAREKAVTEQTGMQVILDRGKQELTLSDNLGKSIHNYPLTYDVKIYRMALADKEILEDTLVVRFLPNGSSERAQVILQSNSGSQVRVINDPLSGGVHLVSDQAEVFP